MENTNLLPITVRFTKDAMDAINMLAETNKKSKAEIVRYGFDNRLINYLSKCVFVDGDDAKKVMSALGDVLSEMQSIKGELRRIGINYNRALKLKEIERKIKELPMDVSLVQKLLELQKEKEKLEKEEDPLTPEKLEHLMSRYEAATKKAGDVLCRILG